MTRILFITSTRLGDAVISTALLRHLGDNVPDPRFTIACGPVAAGVFARLPGLERLIPVEKQRFDAHWPRLWAQLVATRFDLIIDLRGSGLSFFLRAGRRVIMRGGRRPGSRLRHIAQTLGLDPPPLPMAFFNSDDMAQARAALPRGKTLIGLGPTANWTGKIWPPDRFIALYRRLADQLPDPVPVIFGGPGAAERDLAAPVLAALPGSIDCIGKFDLPVVAAQLARMRLFIGNDSGLMHLAASTGAPTLGLFGPSSADEYAPNGPCARAVVAPGPPGATPIDRLSVDQAAEAAFALLAASASAVAHA